MSEKREVAPPHLGITPYRCVSMCIYHVPSMSTHSRGKKKKRPCMHAPERESSTAHPGERHSPAAHPEITPTSACSLCWIPLTRAPCLHRKYYTTMVIPQYRIVSGFFLNFLRASRYLSSSTSHALCIYNSSLHVREKATRYTYIYYGALHGTFFFPSHHHAHCTHTRVHYDL